MAYSYNFDDDSPRFQLNSLWFLLGVLVFAFSVLIMTAIVTGGGNESYYLNTAPQPGQQAKPAAASSPRDVSTSRPTSSGRRY